MTLVISSTSVPINGSAEVIATVTESSGTPAHNGTMVNFTSSFGRMEPSEAPTSGGRAVARFIGNSSGTARISAFSGSATAEITDVKVGGAAAGAIAMRANPASLPQGGGTVQVIAIVRDTSGNPLPGAPVSFTTDQGNLGSTSAITDADGQAETTISTNRDAVVTATVISGVTATTTVRIISAPSVTIATAAGSTPSVGVGVNFTVTPVASTTGTSIQSVTVDFGDGTPPQNLGAISGPTNITHTFASAGTYNVVAAVTDASGQRSTSSVAVNVQRLSPTVTLTPPTSTVPAGGALAFAVGATPTAGGPPISNVTVTMNPGGAVVYSGSGSGSFTRQFSSPGTYTFTASATDTAGTNGTASAVVTVTGLDLTVDAAGGSLSCTTATPKVCSGLTAGTNVTFTASVPTPGATISSYQWNFGDGSPTETTTARVNSHVYTGLGTFVASVTAMTSGGSAANQLITIKSP